MEIEMSDTTGNAQPPGAAGTPEIDAATRERLLRYILKDPYFGSAYPKLGSVEALLDAGLFDLGETPLGTIRADEKWLMTPTHHISRHLEQFEPVNQPIVVLLTTGGFCPVHDGHIEMMTLARRALEARGYLVLGGYLAPDHDAYTLRKCGHDALSAMHRLRLLEERLMNSDWLMADGWASLGVERDINFTDIISRMERYLAHHVTSSRKIEVAYVFGGDNARFARAFIEHGRCVCVLRPGTEEKFFSVAADPLVANNPHIVMADTSSLDFSSTDVRQGRKSLEEGVQRMYAGWANGIDRVAPSASSAVYFLRNEREWAIEPWLANRDRDELIAGYQWFRRGLMRLLKKAHENATEADVRFDVSFHTIDVAKQRKLARRQARGEVIISLDPCVEGDYNLAVSRRFPVCAGRMSPGIIARPGFPSIERQVQALPAGQFVLQDDDIVTGGTMRRVQGRLPKNVEITRWSSLAEREKEDRPVLDIIDCRDFLAGAREGGLVVELPDRTFARSPYCLPYVSPAHGARTPLSQELTISRDIWRLNEQFFNRIAPAIRVSETNIGFRRLMRYLGFDPSTPMSEVCRYHADKSLGFGVGVSL
jgi:nicotinic acid mononucleotide adenylyltransferase